MKGYAILFHRESDMLEYSKPSILSERVSIGVFGCYGGQGGSGNGGHHGHGWGGMGGFWGWLFSFFGRR